MSEKSVFDLDSADRGSSWPIWSAWVFVAGGLAGVLWVAWALSVPGTHFMSTIVIPFAAAVFMVLWILAGTASFLTDRRFDTRRVIAWLLTPLVAIVAYPIVVSDLPARARLELSRPSLDPVARDVAAGRRRPPADGRLGLYRIRDAQRLENGFAFLIEGAGFIDPCGLAYGERGEPAVDGASDLWHIAGPWYGWCWDF